ncbi:hypothetical protein JTE90_008473 [Oedothorax gibbosus]|uniref:Sodium channel protein Nach n=1 Tax=Oedothorax gibbosus TaxID=931172 RepID=A0AAV6V1R9_9ARAC|nr:hypothetical protein JTE90_008473 [Oedothorax gibbosus]
MNLHDGGNRLPLSHPSDILVWNEEDEENGQTDNWRCGNLKKRRKLVAKFAQSSSVNGSSFICSTSKKGPSQFLRVIYRIIFVICLLVVTGNILSLLHEKSSKESIYMNSVIKDVRSGREEDLGNFPIYPRITICRRPFYRTTGYNNSHKDLVAYSMLAFGQPFSPLSLRERTYLRDIAAYNHSDPNATLTDGAVALKEKLDEAEKRYKELSATEKFDLKKFVLNHMPYCTQFFNACTVFVYNLDCCNLFSPLLTSDGLCFTVRNVTPISEIIKDSPIVSEVVLDLVSPPDIVPRSESGFYVYLSDPFREVPMIFEPLEGQTLVTGQATTVKAELIKEKRTELHTPWHSMWNTCPTYRFNDSYISERFSHNVCATQLYEEELRKICECKMIYSTKYPDLKYCEPTDIYKCALRMEDDSLVKEDFNCDYPCVGYSYKTETTYIGLGGGVNISRVKIRYNSEYFTYNEYRQLTLSSFFSQLGGSLGLYLGASIITLMEMLTFTVTWLWYRLVPTKVDDKAANRHDYHTDRILPKHSHRSDVGEDTGRTDKRWRCGNPKRLRDLVSTFGQTASIHGAAYVCSSRKSNHPFCVKVIYRILFVLCLLAVTHALTSFIQEIFFKHSTSINSINQVMEAGLLADENFPRYPRITVCRRPYYKTDSNNQSYQELVSYIMLSLGISYDTFNSQEVGMAFRLVENQVDGEALNEEQLQFKQRLQLLDERYQDLKKSEGFDLEKFMRDHIVDCPEMFFQCVIFMYIYDCCDLFKPVFTTAGLCFTVADVSPIVKQVYKSSVVTDSVIIDVNTPPNPDRDTEFGFAVYLTDSSLENPIVINTIPGENIVPSVVTSIKAQLIKTDRKALHKVWWYKNDPVCSQLTLNSTHSTERYSEDMCLHRLLGEQMKSNCKCKPFFRLYEDSSPLKLCEPFDIYDCMLKGIYEYKDTGLGAACKTPCVEYTYKTESSYMGLEGNDGPISRIEILFDSKQFLYKEYRTPTFTSLFSQMGGSLGLYLGASTITLFELVTFTVTWLWYRLAPAKVARTNKKLRPGRT